MKSEKKLKKEAKAIVDKFLKEVKSKKKTDTKDKAEEHFENKENNFLQEAKKQQKGLMKRVKEVQKMNNKDFANWLMEQYDIYVETINYSIQFDFMSNHNWEARSQIVLFLSQLNIIIELFEIEPLDKEVIDILEKNHYGELLSALNMLNLI